MKSISKMIEENLEFISRAEVASAKILSNAEDGKFEKIVEELENRERLISIVMTTYSNIEKFLEDDANITKMMATELDMVKEWSRKLSIFINKIRDFDGDIICILEKQKTEVSKELTQLFKYKQKFKGYNLNNLRK